MSDQMYEYDDEQDEQDEKPPRSDSEWAELRRAKKAAEKAIKELESFKAEREFEKAGLNPEDPRVAYFRKGYEGDLTAEAIRAEAVKAGFIQETPPEEPDGAPLDAQQRVAEMAGAGGVDMAAAQTAALDQAFAEGGSEGMLQYLASQGIPIAGMQ